MGVPLGLAAHAGGELKQLDAVPDVDLGDGAAFGGQDERDPGQGLLPGLQSDTALR